MHGSDDSKKMENGGYGEVLIAATSDTKELRTESRTLPPASADDLVASMSSIKFFQKIDDDISGEGKRMEACWKRLQKVRLALSNREFNPERSFIRSDNSSIFIGVFLMPFPAVENGEAKIKVHAFDHNETSLPLNEISEELTSLTSYKDVDTGTNVSRKERLNLIKALTEYYDDLLIEPSKNSSKGVQEMDLEVNYFSAAETLHRLNFELVLKGSLWPQFRVGSDLLIISPKQVASFKQKISRYFLDKTERPKVPKTIPGGIRVVRARANGVLRAAEEVASFESPLNDTLADRERRTAQVDLKIEKLQTLGRDILHIMSAKGSALDLFKAIVMTELLVETEATPVGKYTELFQLNDEAEAIMLARKVAEARLEISSMNLPREIVSSLIGGVLTKKTSRTDIWEKMYKAEK
jgi:hypothetical protein